jgi:hypothetical protein
MEFFPDKNWSKTYTSAAEAIYGTVQYTDKNDLTFVDVFGLTGHAFRMNIDPEIINAAGPTSFPGGYIFRRNLCNLGFTSSMTEMNTLITPEILEQTMNLVQKSLDKGIPVMSFIYLFLNSELFMDMTMRNKFSTPKMYHKMVIYLILKLSVKD